MDPVLTRLLLLLLLLLLFWAPSGLEAASVFHQCPSGQVLSPVDLLCYTCSRCICPDSPVHEGCLSQGLTSSHACLPRQACTDTTQNAAVAPPHTKMLTKEETQTKTIWVQMTFGTLGSFIVLCVVGVVVVKCIISVKNCRNSNQYEPANESTGTGSGDHEDNNSSQPSSTEGQTNSTYQPDAGLA
ncbi:hypothetical protein LSAT2_007144 [Lamellibrachia satsuma]|nr:hypothetical protein LSAT2_007144 [Lamellibrachia satsuma]